MEMIFHKASERGFADHGWLKAHHSFSFANWYQPDRVNFGALRVLNDDLVAPGMGFGMHPHDNMEIITIPLSGRIAHKDSMGNAAEIVAGEIQVMSAGTGVLHSEFNPSETEQLSLFQIWIFPDKRNVTPRYDQVNYEKLLIEDRFTLLVSNQEDQAPVWIHQDAKISIGSFRENQRISYEMDSPQNGVYLMLIEGQIKIGEQLLNKRDAIGVWNTKEIGFDTTSASKVLAIEIPMS
jgi:redox-sensitive bicupin YhaK (pirin superfamily)